jgi:hypothetical protein
MTLIDDLRDPKLGLDELRARIQRAPDTTAHDAWLAIVRDATVPRQARRLVIRRLFEAGPRTDIALADLGARVGAAAWLQPAHVRQVDVVAGKIPVRWAPEDEIVTVDVCPDPGEGRQLVVYLRIAGKPSIDEIVSGLRDGAGARHLVREIGFFENEPARDPSGAGRPAVPALAGVVLCRRALCDAETRLHTLVDVLVDVPVGQLPGPASFDVYLQLWQISGAVALVVEVLDGEVVLSTGTLTLDPGAQHPSTATPALGVAIPNVSVNFARPGAHRLRVRAGDSVLGEHPFMVSGGAA